jgi:hypothetical protein
MRTRPESRLFRWQRATTYMNVVHMVWVRIDLLDDGVMYQYDRLVKHITLYTPI